MAPETLHFDGGSGEKETVVLMGTAKKHPGLISPYMMAGVLAILLPIFLFITFDRLERQKIHLRESLFTMGSSLIRTFEAGTRSGMLSMPWGIRKIQNMLLETSFQPDIAYISITDNKGKILAHSDPSMVGKILGNMPDLSLLNQDALSFSSRGIERGDEQVFEVFKRFTPLQSRVTVHRRHGHGRRMYHHSMDGTAPVKPISPKKTQTVSNPHFPVPEGHPVFFPSGEYYIFTGLSMDRMNRIQKQVNRHAVVSGILFFLLGGAGVISLMVFQAYRSTRASLTQVQAFSDNLVRNMPTGLVTIDKVWTITSMNQAARQILGWKLKKPFSQMKNMAREMAASGKVVSKEFDLDTKDGSTLRLDMTGSPIFEKNDNMTGFLFLFRDLTQIRALEKEVETTRRLAVIGKLAGGVAHEIRNPLSSIKGFATYFMKRCEHEPKDVETAGIMVQEVERINRSITQLLEFATPLAAQKKDVEVAPLIAHSLRLAEHDFKEKNIEVRVEVEPGLTRFHTDPDHISQILLNLYMNALHAMKKGGTLDVRAKAVPCPGNKGIEIRVRDNGSGMDKQTLDQIFDPYFTTRPDGTGLGLSIVHRMTENLGGTIRAESQPGKGTECILFFPESGQDREDNS